jgi:hypothetical protein
MGPATPPPPAQADDPRTRTPISGSTRRRTTWGARARRWRRRGPAGRRWRRRRSAGTSPGRSGCSETRCRRGRRARRCHTTGGRPRSTARSACGPSWSSPRPRRPQEAPGPRIPERMTPRAGVRRGAAARASPLTRGRLRNSGRDQRAVPGPRGWSAGPLRDVRFPPDADLGADAAGVHAPPDREQTETRAGRARTLLGPGPHWRCRRNERSVLPRGGARPGLRRRGDPPLAGDRGHEGRPGGRRPLLRRGRGGAPARGDGLNDRRRRYQVTSVEAQNTSLPCGSRARSAGIATPAATAPVPATPSRRPPAPGPATRAPRAAPAPDGGREEEEGAGAQDGRAHGRHGGGEARPRAHCGLEALRRQTGARRRGPAPGGQGPARCEEAKRVQGEGGGGAGRGHDEAAERRPERARQVEADAVQCDRLRHVTARHQLGRRRRPGREDHGGARAYGEGQRQQAPGAEQARHGQGEACGARERPGAQGARSSTIRAPSGQVYRPAVTRSWRLVRAGGDTTRSPPSATATEVDKADPGGARAAGATPLSTDPTSAVVPSRRLAPVPPRRWSIAGP